MPPKTPRNPPTKKKSSQHPMVKIENVDKEEKTVILLGQCYLVTRAGQETGQYAEIIEINSKSTDPDGPNYYVHYQGCDRRLDEWISRDRIDIKSQKRKADAVVAMQMLSANGHRTMTRNQKRLYDEINHIQPSWETMDAVTQAIEKERENMTKVKNIGKVQFGTYEIEAWYFSPYPEPYDNLETLYVCEYCMRYMRYHTTYMNHVEQCTARQPPGSEMYRKANLSVYEVDGKQHKLYCQCLCLLSKLFLDHKTLYYGVEEFMFYVLCEVKLDGAHFVGYFSKEKLSPDNNLSCIMTLPPFQRAGYGKFLIDMSYKLSLREKKIGSPERPLSDLGKRTYMAYWAWALFMALKKMRGTVMIKKLSKVSCIAEPDILETLTALHIIQYWKGHRVILVTDHLLDQCATNDLFRMPKLVVDETRLRWQPPKPARKPKSIIKKPAARPMMVATKKGGEVSFHKITEIRHFKKERV